MMQRFAGRVLALLILASALGGCDKCADYFIANPFRHQARRHMPVRRGPRRQVTSARVRRRLSAARAAPVHDGGEEAHLRPAPPMPKASGLRSQ